MEIKCLDPLGINGYEREANRLLSISLPESWKGYSSLEMRGRQSKEFEGDIIIVTHDRIINVELKNWSGKIFAKDGKWVVQFPNGQEEHRTNGVRQARRSAQVLASKLKERLNDRYLPFIDYCVVLCGTATKDDLPNDEKEYVFTLDEFTKIGDENIYKKYFSNKPNQLKRKEDAPNRNKAQWDKIFSNNSVDFKAKTFSVNNYVIQGSPLFQHREFLYSEYMSQRSDNHNYKAILRRWDFTSPCIIEHAKTPEERLLIAHRESDVLGYIGNQDEDLKDLYLGLEYLPSELSNDFVELYEWPNKKERLDTFMRKNNDKLTEDNRLDLIQSLISHLANLHDIDVAHRDIGNHSIWVSLPSKIVLSNFLTATYPDPSSKTLSNIRKVLQQNQIITPEELFEDADGTHFTRDVYLAIVSCHYIAFGYLPKKEEEIYLWEPIESNSISSRLKDWFERGLELEASKRFKDLREALTELNKLLKTSEINSNNKLDVMEPYYSSKNIYVDYTVIPIKIEGTVHLYQSTDQTFGLKAWFGVRDVSPNGGLNNQLLSFFNRLEIRKNLNLACLPKIIDYGLNLQMTCAYFQFEWIRGISWNQSIDSKSIEAVVSDIKLLLLSLIELHSAGIFHGDIHPENIMLKEDNLVFIDVIELEENLYTPSYVPDNYENISKSSIDNYAVIKIINELSHSKKIIHLSQYTNKLIELPEISDSEIFKLHDQLEKIISPPNLEEITEYKIFHRDISEKQTKFLSDDGRYYVELEVKKGNKKDLVLVRITGVKHKLFLLIHPIDNFVVKATLSEIRHNEFVNNKKNSMLHLNGDIVFAKFQSESSENFYSDIIESPIYQELLKQEEKLEDNIDVQETLHPSMHIRTSKIVDAKGVWQALVDTEHESNPKVQISTEPRIQGEKYIFDYTNEEGTLDFNLNTEHVFVCAERNFEQRKIGKIVDIGPNSMIINVWGKNRIQLGDTLTLEGALTASSLNKRKLATENLINSRSVIKNIADYFSPGLDIIPEEKLEPTDADLDFYTEKDGDNNVLFELNTQQREAFKGLYKYGPVGLLQGPPGTGKTAFIGSFIHYCILRGARRVLLVSQSHEAVNNATEKVRSLFGRNDTEIDIVRFGDQHVLSEQLNDVGERTLQEHYRDKFKAEYEERINKVASEIGLDADFTKIATEFERSFGRKIDYITSQMKDMNSEEIQSSITTRLSKLTNNLVEFFYRKIQMSLNLEGTELSHYRDVIYLALSKHYAIYSPNLVLKFRNIISISNEWLSVMASSQSQFQNFLSKTRTLVCGTCVGIGRNHYGIQENVYDLVVIDEAARSPASELAIAMQVGRKVLLVGDHKQLPPLFDEAHIKAAKRLLPSVSIDELKRSDFERAFVSSYGKTVGRYLKVQYRMIPAVGNLISDCFYAEEGGLETGRSITRQSYLELFEHICTPVTWFDTRKAKLKSFESKPIDKNANQNSYINKYEAEIILELLNRISEHKNFEKILIEDEDPKIGIICMYGEQVKYLLREINGVAWTRKLLEKGVIKVDTIDSYQGKENDIIIVSLVRSNSRGRQGYVASENRANVALSRAKEALFIVGNGEMWQKYNENSAFGKVYNYISSRNNSSEYLIVDTETFKDNK